MNLKQASRNWIRLAEKSPEKLDGQQLATIIKTLTSLEKEEGGPYYSSLNNQTIDIEANARVAQFLSLLDIHLPKLDRFLQQHPIKKTKRPKQISKKQTLSFAEKNLHQQIVTQAKKELTGFNLKYLDKIATSEHRYHITLLPYYFKKALGKTGLKISEQIIFQLGLANLLGWIAYTIYDNFLDQEGQPQDLPIANVCLRKLTQIFSALEESLIFNQIMDQLEQANVWETQKPEFSNLLPLAQKSLGHGLGPLVILLKLGHSLNSKPVKDLQDFFINYLLAKQLNDDAHDWEIDLRNQHPTPVTEAILKLTDNPQEYSLMFWDKVLVEFCQKILLHTQQARQALKKLTLLEKPEYLEKFLLPAEKAAQLGLSERQKTLDFINTFSLK